jgi:hypothetical protein
MGGGGGGLGVEGGGGGGRRGGCAGAQQGRPGAAPSQGAPVHPPTRPPPHPNTPQTRDNVFCTLVVSIQAQVAPESLYEVRRGGGRGGSRPARRAAVPGAVAAAAARGGACRLFVHAPTCCARPALPSDPPNRHPAQAFYRLTDYRSQIKSYVFDVVRASVPKILLDDGEALAGARPVGPVREQ